MGPITPWVEAFLTGLFEHLPEGIVLCDERQIVLRANPAFCRLFGYEAEETAGRFLDDLVAGGTPGYGEAVAYTESILSGRSVKVPATRHAKDGTAVDVLATGIPVIVAGRVVGVLALYEDISESVRSRHALEETKARLEATLEGIGDAVVTVDERGNVTDLNAAASSLTGWPVDEARGLPVSSLLRFRSGDGDPSPLLEGHHGEAAETLLVDRSGLAHPVTVQTTPVRLGRGRAPGVVVVVRDESERLRRRTEITAAQALYGSLVDSLPDLVFRFSPSGRCLFAPPRAEESLAVAHPPLEGRTFREAGLDEALCRRWEALLQRALTTKALVEETLEMDGPKGPRLYDCRVVEGPRSTGLLALCRDVTESRETETNYRLLFESMRDAFILHEAITDAGGDIVDHRLVDVNAAFEKETGLSREVVGKTLLDLFPHGDPFWAEVCGDVVRTGEARRFTRFIPPLEKVFDGVVYRTKPSHCALLLRDVTELERTRRRKEHLGQVLRSIREINRLLVFERDRERLLQSVCDLFVDQRGYLSAWIALFDGAGRTDTFHSAGPFDDEEAIRAAVTANHLPPCVGGCLAGEAILRQPAHPLLCSGCTYRTKGTNGGVLAARLEGGSSLRGLLSVAAPEGFEPDEEERTLFREVADDVAFALSLLDDDAAKRKAREELASSFLKVRRAQEGTIAVLSRMVESRDVYTAGHQERVARLALALARRMGLTSETQEAVFMAGRLHDVGKIRVPSEILNKPGRLSPLELAIVREHPQSGWEILRDIDFPWPVADIVLNHHERLDGSGYPRGLGAEALSLEARLIAVADVVEAMSAHRPYRPAPGIEAALDEIRRGAGTIYDEGVVTACLELFRKGFDFDGENPFISS